MLNNTNTLPPGGWIYEQKDDAGAAVLRKFKNFGPFTDAAREIQSFRLGNKLKRSELAEVMDDLDAATCERLGYDPQWCTVQKKTSPAKWSSLLPGALGVVARHAEAAVKASFTGTRVLADWLGDGAKPVAPELAQARANVCFECPDNQDGIANFTGSIAKAILEQVRIKSEQGIWVFGEAKLHTCSVCRCHLPLKVQVPLNHILANTDPDTLKNFPANCWMLTEQTPETTNA